MSENWWQSEICIVIDDKSQDSTAKHVSYDGSLYYVFVIHCAGERIFKIREHLALLQAKWLIVSYAPFALDFCPQRCRTRWISKITCLLTIFIRPPHSRQIQTDRQTDKIQLTNTTNTKLRPKA